MIHLLIIVIYVSFISLGLPDGLLGSAWPSMYESMNVPVSYAGFISMIISGCTIVSALQSERLVNKLGTGGITAVSVGTTAAALFGFSMCSEFWQLCLWAVPYGLGAGSVDAALNNYVAVHYKSHHMSWLHCFWGVGCSCGPYVMSYFLTHGHGWSKGYFSIFILQLILTIILVLSLPLWKKKSPEIAVSYEEKAKPLGLKKTVSISGVKEMMLTFLCYCAIEQTAGLWAVSYIVFAKGVTAEKAAGFGAVFYLGITIGRFLSGFMTAKFNDVQMVRMGVSILLIGAAVIFLPFGGFIPALAGLWLIGFGCAPVYPCLIHSIPIRFGANSSQAVIGVQMASAYVGSSLMPPLFGFIAGRLSISVFPICIIILLCVMLFFSERLNSFHRDAFR